MRRRRPIPDRARRALADELAAARTAADQWPHLERADIVSQPWAWPHTRVHWAMLGCAIRQRDRREVVGQLVRLAVAGPGSLAGRYRTGNTGRTTMRLTATAPVPADLEGILET
ncbi:MAG: DUF3703 domain-containing protein [Ilumatobacteraceae bacterium]